MPTEIKKSTGTKQTTPAPAQPPKAKTKEQEKDEARRLWIGKFRKEIEQYEAQVLPDLLKQHGMSVEKFKQIVVNEIKRDEKLLEAFISNPASMFASILAGAEIGLTPSELLGEFFLIPRKIDNVLTVTPQIGYLGIVNILMRSGHTTRIHTEVVYKGDEYEVVYGIEPNIIHKPNFEVDRSAKNITHAYAVAKNKHGEHTFKSMTRKEIIAVKDMSKYDNKLYFNDAKDPNNWMLRKTVLIQLAKTLEKDYYSTKAIQLNGKLEGGAILTLDNTKQVKVIENKITAVVVPQKRFRNIYATMGEDVDDENQEQD